MSLTSRATKTNRNDGTRMRETVTVNLRVGSIQIALGGLLRAVNLRDSGLQLLAIFDRVIDEDFVIVTESL